MALTEKLSAIGNAIRAKTGGTEKLTLDQMPTEIEGIETGGGGGTEVEPIVLTGNQNYGCAGNLAGTYIKLFGDTIITKDLTLISNMFYNNKVVEEIPFEINMASNSSSMSYLFYSCEKLKHIPNIDCKHNSYVDMSYIFQSCKALTELPYLYNAYPSNLGYFFANCYNLRTIPEDYFDTWNFSRINSYTSCGMGSVFTYCYSLRKIPEKIFNYFAESATTSIYSCFYNNALANCYALDEVNDFPVLTKPTFTSNVFSNTFHQLHRAKNFTFKLNEDGTAQTANWKNQSLYFASIGTSNSISDLLSYNSGITADKQVTDDTTYQALKNDPDWFTTNKAYSRYNHDSAVATINSLPDTSAYLATAGGTNTIKFTGASGELTDGGAINTLTEEEIAVATAKGWTVSFV